MALVLWFDNPTMQSMRLATCVCQPFLDAVDGFVLCSDNPTLQSMRLAT